MSILRAYITDFAEFSPDLLCPEISCYNTRQFSDFWKLYAGNNLSRIPYWAIVWPGSRALGRYLLDHPEIARQKKILDLGCGSGLASLALSALSAHVHAVDTDRDALALLRLNKRKNSKLCRGRITGEKSDFLEWSVTRFQAYDLVLFGDLFYEEQLACHSIRLMQDLAGMGIRHIAADALRNHRPQTGFSLLKTYPVPVFKEIESVSVRSVNLIEMTP